MTRCHIQKEDVVHVEELGADKSPRCSAGRAPRLLTGYLGGAVASQVRAGSGWFELVFPVLFAVPLWGGLWLRDHRLRRILALAAEAPEVA